MTELTSTNPHVATWLNHIRTLAVDIGPRGPTRPEERLGALYAQAQFEKMGLKPVFETFYSAQSIFHPHLLGSGLDAAGIHPVSTIRQNNGGPRGAAVHLCVGLRVTGAQLSKQPLPQDGTER